MTLNKRAYNAFKKTRDMGIPDEDIKPVLKHLLKVFEKNWEHIEAEDYRVLIDTYFEQDNKEEINRKRGPVGSDGFDNPPKRMQSDKLEDQVSSTLGNSSQTMQQKTCEMPRAKGKEPIGSYPASRGVKSSSEKATSAAYVKQPRDEPRSAHVQKANPSSSCCVKELVKPDAELSIDNSRNNPEPVSVIYPGTNSRNDGSMCSNSKSWKSNIEIASSTLGDVKLSLKCNSSIRRSNFRNPKLDAVMRFMEDKYLRSYKNLEPQFSMTSLLRDLCESYLKLGTDSTASSDMVKSSPRIAVTSHKSFHDSGLNLGASSSSTSEIKSDKKSLKPHCEGIVQQPIIPKKPFHNLRDISKGSEIVRISLLDETGTENLPKFTYIPQNIVYQNAFLNISLARISDHDCCSRCSGNCLSSSIPCECAGQTGGEFAYTEQGLLKEGFLESCISLTVKPQPNDFFYCPGVCPMERTKNEYMPDRCKGHLVRKFIKECWRKCGCDMKCGNRIVQRGITCKLEVFMTREGKGWGLRTLQDLSKGTFVCEYVGEILTNMELYERNSQSSGNERHTYPVTLDADWGSEGILKDEEALCLDATMYGNVARFINHRCHDANLLDIPVEVENPDHHYYHVAFFTTRDVKALEELTWDYGIDFNDDEHPIKAFECSCLSTYCRGKKLNGTVQTARR